MWAAGNWLGVGADCATLDDCPQLAFGFPESDDASRKLENFRYRHVGRLCDVEDVVINGGGATPHPLHFHVNHFQVVSYAGNAATLADWGEVGDWRDTIPAIGGGQLRFRHALDEHGGNVMMHCHFLWHEDQGMMDRYYIAGNNEDGTGSVDPCTADGANFCDDSVPTSALTTPTLKSLGPALCTDLLPATQCHSRQQSREGQNSGFSELYLCKRRYSH